MFSTFILVANPNPTHGASARPVPQEHGRHRHVRADAAGQQPHDVLAAGRVPGAARIGRVLDRRREHRGRQADRRRAGDVLRSVANRAAASRAADTTRVGVPEASNEWYFAEGFTGGNAQTAFETFLLLANTNGAATTATVTYQLDSGQTVTRDYALAPNQRLTVWVDEEGRTFDARLKAASFGMTGDSRRSRSSPNAPCTGARRRPRTRPHRRSRGGKAMRRPGRRCWHPGGRLPKGAKARTRSVRPYSTFFLLSNPSAVAGHVKATFLTEDGGGLTTTGTIPAGGRANIWTTAGLPAFSALANRRFATFHREHRRRDRSSPNARCTLFTDFQQPVTSTWARRGQAHRRASASAGHGHGHGLHAGPDAPQRRRADHDHAVPASRIDRKSRVDGIPMTVTSATSTAITAITPVRTATTGFGAVGPSRVRLTASGFTTVAGTIQRVFRVLAIGDSFTEGQLVERIRFHRLRRPANPTPTARLTQTYSFAAPPYPEALEGVLRTDAQYGATADVDNAGFSGECASIAGCSGNPTRGADRIGPLVTAKKYDVVIILEGFNDLNAGGSLSGAITALRSMGTTARASGATVLMGRIHVMRTDMLDAIRTMALEEKFTPRRLRHQRRDRRPTTFTRHRTATRRWPASPTARSRASSSREGHAAGSGVGIRDVPYSYPWRTIRGPPLSSLLPRGRRSIYRDCSASAHSSRRPGGHPECCPGSRSRSCFAAARPLLSSLKAASTWFLAEGASNGTFDEDILVGNPSAGTLSVTVTLLPAPDAVVTPGQRLEKVFTVPARDA